VEIDAQHRPVVARARRRGTLLAGRALALGLLALAAVPAHGWGAAGHRIVGDVAEQLLDPHARTALAALAPGAGLGGLGLWLDEDKRELAQQQPGSERWHYDNRPACRESAPLAGYCGDGNCASAAYARYLAVLRDRQAAPAERAFALKVVVHVLADVHQPLHVADNGDRGANGIRVSLGRGRRSKTLHSAWDVDFVRRAQGEEPERAFASELVAAYAASRAQLDAGDFASWTAQSHRLARDYAYGRLPAFACGASATGVVHLSESYADGAARIVREQLARAGYRLAAVLNAAL
jgi:S1/P1 Nuclease